MVAKFLKEVEKRFHLQIYCHCDRFSVPWQLKCNGYLSLMNNCILFIDLSGEFFMGLINVLGHYFSHFATMKFL